MRFKLSYPNSDSIELNLSNDRLPSHVVSIGPVKCNYMLNEQSDYYCLTLETDCQLILCCQRCMESFEYHYHNNTQLGLCYEETVAEQIMSILDPIVLVADEIPFETLIIDELYLYLPLFHKNEAICQTNLSDLN